MRYFLILTVLMLTACQSAVPFEAETDRCGSLGYLSNVGLKEADIAAGTFPDRTRFIKPDTPTTRDYRAERLNVHINQQGRIERIDCG